MANKTSESSGNNGAETKPIRIQRKRTKGWKMPANTVYVGKGTPYGNPFFGSGCVQEFRKMHEIVADEHNADIIITTDDDGQIFEAASAKMIKQNLRGKNLACWCSLQSSCHADILLSIANN